MHVSRAGRCTPTWSGIIDARGTAGAVAGTGGKDGGSGWGVLQKSGPGGLPSTWDSGWPGDGRWGGGGEPVEADVPCARAGLSWWIPFTLWTTWESTGAAIGTIWLLDFG